MENNWALDGEKLENNLNKQLVCKVGYKVGCKTNFCLLSKVLLRSKFIACKHFLTSLSGHLKNWARFGVGLCTCSQETADIKPIERYLNYERSHFC